MKLTEVISASGQSLGTRQLGVGIGGIFEARYRPRSHLAI